MDQIPAGPRSYRANPTKRNIFAQIGMVLLQPRAFFRTQRTAGSQHWLLAALIVLALIGASAVRQQQLAAGQDSADISLTWKPALTAASETLLEWLSLSVILIIVSMSNSLKPQFDQNLRVVVWASVPLGLMAGLQLLYYASGGHPGLPGISGLVANIPGFSDLPSLSQQILLALGARLTIFWLWSLILLYLGARYTLGGMRGVIVLVLGLWIAWLVLLPLGVASLSSTNTDPLPTVVPFSEGTQSP